MSIRQKSTAGILERPRSACYSSGDPAQVPNRLTHEEYDDQEFCETLQNKVIREARAPGSRLLQQLCEVHVRFDAPQVEPADTYYWTFNNVQDILMLPLKDQRTTLSSYRIFQHTSPSVQSSDVHCSKEA